MKIKNGRICLDSLEFFASDTCNLRCRHCTISSPYLTEPNFPDADQFKNSLAVLSDVLHCRQIKILGGEPLLNPSLCDLMQIARQSGVFDSVRVTTNGILLKRVPPEFWELADVVEITLYPGVAQSPTPDMFESYRKIASNSGTLLESKTKRFFMRAVISEKIADDTIVERIFGECGEAHGWSCHLMYGDHLYRCSRIPTMDKFLNRLNVAHVKFTTEDGLPIRSREGLFDAIKSYLESPDPLHACRFCLGTSGVFKETKQLTIRQIRSKRNGKPAAAFNSGWLRFNNSEAM